MIAPSLFYIALSSEMGILSIPNDSELLSLVFRGLDNASRLRGLVSYKKKPDIDFMTEFCYINTCCILKQTHYQAIDVNVVPLKCGSGASVGNTLLVFLVSGTRQILWCNARFTKPEQGQLCCTADNTRFHHPAKQLLLRKKQAKIGFNPSVFSGSLSCRVQTDLLCVGEGKV